MVPIKEVTDQLRAGYAPMVLHARLTPKGLFLKLEVRYPDDRFFASGHVQCSDFRSKQNIDNVIRCHRRQMCDSGIALNAWHDQAHSQPCGKETSLHTRGY
jgi:hypothetical protein